MPDKQSPHDAEQLRAALERIRDMACAVLAETDNLLSDSAHVCTSGSGSTSDLARAKDDLKKLREDLREQRHIGSVGYDMECSAKEARHVLQRAKDLGSEWSEAVSQSLAEQLTAAKTEANNLAVRLIELGLQDFLKRTQDRAAYLKRHPEQLSPWDAKAIRDESEDLDKVWDEEIKAKCADRLRGVRQEALALADELETYAHLNNIEAALSRRICNVLSVQRVREEMIEATEFLAQKGKLTPQLQQRIRQSRERAARFRADKKLADARVAEAGGRTKSAEMLKREAAAVQAMDWEAFFPGETAPPIS